MASSLLVCISRPLTKTKMFLRAFQFNHVYTPFVHFYQISLCVNYEHVVYTKPSGLPHLMSRSHYCRTYISGPKSTFGDLRNLSRVIWFSRTWFQCVKLLALCCYASTFRLLPLMIWVCAVSSVSIHPEWTLSVSHTLIKTSAMTHHSNISVRDHMKWVSGTYLQNQHLGFSVSRRATPLSSCSCDKSCGPFFALTCRLCCQAGLLGCEAVLSSMALMQANNISGQKKMMSPLGQGHRASPDSHQNQSQHSHNHHGHQVHHGQPHNSHMGHSSAGSCPPLVRKTPATTSFIF